MSGNPPTDFKYALWLKPYQANQKVEIGFRLDFRHLKILGLLCEY